MLPIYHLTPEDDKATPGTQNRPDGNLPEGQGPESNDPNNPNLYITLRLTGATYILRFHYLAGNGQWTFLDDYDLLNAAPEQGVHPLDNPESAKDYLIAKYKENYPSTSQETITQQFTQLETVTYYETDASPSFDFSQNVEQAFITARGNLIPCHNAIVLALHGIALGQCQAEAIVNKASFEAFFKYLSASLEQATPETLSEDARLQHRNLVLLLESLPQEIKTAFADYVLRTAPEGRTAVNMLKALFCHLGTYTHNGESYFYNNLGNFLIANASARVLTEFVYELGQIPDHIVQQDKPENYYSYLNAFPLTKTFRQATYSMFGIRAHKCPPPRVGLDAPNTHQALYYVHADTIIEKLSGEAEMPIIWAQFGFFRGLSDAWLARCVTIEHGNISFSNETTQWLTQQFLAIHYHANALQLQMLYKTIQTTPGESICIPNTHFSTTNENVEFDRLFSCALRVSEHPLSRLYESFQTTQPGEHKTLAKRFARTVSHQLAPLFQELARTANSAKDPRKNLFPFVACLYEVAHQLSYTFDYVATTQATEKLIKQEKRRLLAFASEHIQDHDTIQGLKLISESLNHALGCAHYFMFEGITPAERTSTNTRRLSLFLMANFLLTTPMHHEIRSRCLNKLAGAVDETHPHRQLLAKGIRKLAEPGSPMSSILSKTEDLTRFKKMFVQFVSDPVSDPEIRLKAATTLIHLMLNLELPDLTAIKQAHTGSAPLQPNERRERLNTALKKFTDNGIKQVQLPHLQRLQNQIKFYETLLADINLSTLTENQIIATFNFVHQLHMLYIGAPHSKRPEKYVYLLKSLYEMKSEDTDSTLNGFASHFASNGKTNRRADFDNMFYPLGEVSLTVTSAPETLDISKEIVCRFTQLPPPISLNLDVYRQASAQSAMPFFQGGFM